MRNKLANNDAEEVTHGREKQHPSFVMDQILEKKKNTYEI